VPWAFAIARRLLIDVYRKSGREVFDDDEDGERRSSAPSAAPDRLAGQHRLVSRMEEELACVPKANREAFDLVERDGLSMTEAAEVLGVTEMAVRLRVHRAREVVRAKLGADVREELEEQP
jgi:RNA polymerase sigma-70 factor (ECF subfamily)